MWNCNRFRLCLWWRGKASLFRKPLHGTLGLIQESGRRRRRCRLLFFSDERKNGPAFLGLTFYFFLLRVLRFFLLGRNVFPRFGLRNARVSIRWFVSIASNSSCAGVPGAGGEAATRLRRWGLARGCRSSRSLL